jgi:hypothetical protein
MEVLAQKARALRAKHPALGDCPHCFNHHARSLMIGCCVCTGDIDLTRKDIFTRH